jgi:hypothetical protein
MSRTPKFLPDNSANMPVYGNESEEYIFKTSDTHGTSMLMVFVIVPTRLPAVRTTLKTLPGSARA